VVARIFQHIVFWALYVVISSFIFSYKSRYPYYFFLENYLINLIAYIAFTYLAIYIIAPALLYKRKVVLFIVTLVPISFLFVVFKLVLTHYVFYNLLIPKVFHPDEWISYKLFIENFFWLWIPTLVFAALKYFREWLNTIREKNELQQKQLEAELKLLKAQLHPHFLFNTLNNLYVLALEKSDRTPDVVMKISDLFHYILYECNSDEIELEKEVELIQNYIELEKLRYDENLSVTFNYEGNIKNRKIAPMLLFVFVENAFKHGCRNDPGSPWIKLNLAAFDDRVVFVAENSLPSLKVLNKVGDGGIGLDNLYKRLTLIYPERHQITINETEKSFRVELMLSLKTGKDEK